MTTGEGWLYKKLDYKERLLTYGQGNTYGIRSGNKEKGKREVVRVILTGKRMGNPKKGKNYAKGRVGQRRLRRLEGVNKTVMLGRPSQMKKGR